MSWYSIIISDFCFLNEGLSIRKIAKRDSIHRNTVTRAIKSRDNRYNLMVEKDRPVNGPFEEKMKLMVEENYDKPKT